MRDLKDVIDLEEVINVDVLKKEIVSLRRENHAAMKTIEKLLKDSQKKNDEITQLQLLLAQSVPLIKAPVLVDSKPKEVSAEEEIAQLQLERLRIAAKARPLTLEETRMYDLLVKNKRLASDEPTVNMLSKGSYRDVGEIELLKIAEKAKEPDESDKS